VLAWLNRFSLVLFNQFQTLEIKFEFFYDFLIG
jgi:hypothetical protein